MALSRKTLKAMGLTEEQVESIIEAHTETVNALKTERDNYKAEAEKLPSVQEELDALKAAGDGGWEEKSKSWEKKYNDLLDANEKKEAHQAKEAAYRDLLKTAGVSEKLLDKVLRLCDVDAIEMEDGKVKGVDALTEAIKTDWGDYIETANTAGTQTATPAGTNGGGLTRAEILRKPYAEQVKIFNQNPDAYRQAMKGE